MNLNGLLILFDEAEAINFNSYLSQIDNSRQFIQALVRISSNDEILLKHPIESKLGYCMKGKSHTIPYLFRIPSNLKIIMAVTPGRALELIEQLIMEILKDRISIKLDALTQKNYEKISLQIKNIYESAYSIKFDDIDILKIIENKKSDFEITRSFVKGSVEILDLCRFNQH